jgi:hypothetical protein
VRDALTSAAVAEAGPALGIWAVTIALLLVVDVPTCVALVVLLYELTGSEVLRATPWMLCHERRLLGLPYRRSWPCARISEMRLAPQSGGVPEPRLLGRRGVLFVVDGKRLRGMAEGCTPAEAAEVLAVVDEALHAPTITR